tara:strand:+ start:228 stop:1070 length:843 start_codon:yes stop_codon:yes gene_type:complete
MHTAAKVAIGLGFVIILIGAFVLFTGDSFEENIEEGIIYEGTTGEVALEAGIAEDTETRYYVHLVNSQYEGGSQGGWNDKHGNSTWNLTEKDCNIVKSFSMKDNSGKELFYPKCNYVEDSTVDKYIVVGHLCTTPIGEYTDDEGYTWFRWSGDGCPIGTFNFETDGNTVMVYDTMAILGAIGDWIVKWLGSFGACCCGSVILIIGIIMGFTMNDNNSNTYVQETTYGSTTAPRSGWNEQEDYIHRQKEDDEVPEKSEIAIPDDTGKSNRSGEYELPPPEN